MFKREKISAQFLQLRYNLILDAVNAGSVTARDMYP